MKTIITIEDEDTARVSIQVIKIKGPDDRDSGSPAGILAEIIESTLKQHLGSANIGIMPIYSAMQH